VLDTSQAGLGNLETAPAQGQVRGGERRKRKQYSPRQTDVSRGHGAGRAERSQREPTRTNNEKKGASQSRHRVSTAAGQRS